MSKKKSSIRIKQEKKRQEALAIARALAHAKRRSRAIPNARSRKVTDLVAFVSLPLGTHPRALRPMNEFVARSYCPARSIVGLVDHVFVRYPVPRFLYRTVLNRRGLMAVFGDRLRGDTSGWNLPLFFAAAQGESVADLLRSRCSRAEAHWFLKAPDAVTLDQALLWAKARALGLDPVCAQFVSERLGASQLMEQFGERLPDMLAFFGRHFEEMDSQTRENIALLVGYLAYRDFCFKRRTLKSMVEKWYEWYGWTNNTSSGQFQSWRSKYGYWETPYSGGVVRAFELTSNRALVEEGTYQRHCSGTYVQNCATGKSRVVSFRWMPDESGQRQVRVTIEVRVGGIVAQTCGRYNAYPEPDQLAVIEAWAKEFGCSL